jgi:hypothetical protein
MIYDQKPPLDEALLAHHGVKGMHWGVVHEPETTGRATSKKQTIPSKNPNPSPASEVKRKEAYKAAKPPPLTKKQAAEKLEKSKEAHLAKLEPSVADGSSKKLSPEQKATLKKVGIGLGVVAVVAGGAYLATRGRGGSGVDQEALAKIGAYKELAGKPIHPDAFKANIKHSIEHSWASPSYLTDASFDRPAFTLPAGHTFHRLSTTAEDSFKSYTYSTHNIADFNRYVTHFRGEKSSALQATLHHVSWTTEQPVHVPTLTTTLETLKEVIGDKNLTDKGARIQYEAVAGGGWDGPVASRLISALKKKGYGALVDEMDSGIVGESPIVLFAEHMSSKTAVPLTEQAIKAAENALTEITNRKGVSLADAALNLVHFDFSDGNFLVHFDNRTMDAILIFIDRVFRETEAVPNFLTNR